jgi:hypothetical protein
VRRSVPTAAAASILVCLLLSGCPGTIDDPDRFAPVCRTPIDVEAVFARSCGSSDCHDDLDPEGDLDLLSPGVATRLVSQPASACASRLRIDPLNLDASLLLQKLSHDDPGCGSRMPLEADPLPPDTIECIRDWAEAAVLNAGSDGGPSTEGGD